MRPKYLICDPLPSEEGDRPATYILRIIEPASLWVVHDEDESNIRLHRCFEDLEKYNAQTLARFAREVGDFWKSYCDETD